MSRELKSGQYDPSPNLTVRKMGNGIYCGDLDLYLYEFLGDELNSTRTTAFVDWKHFRTKIISFDDETAKDRWSLRAIRDLANREGAPFFVGITWSKPEDGYGANGEPEMYCLVPCNKLAAKAIRQHADGVWFSPRRLCEFFNSLRLKPLEKKRMELDHLSDKFKQYKLNTVIDKTSLMKNWKMEK